MMNAMTLNVNIFMLLFSIMFHFDFFKITVMIGHKKSFDKPIESPISRCTMSRPLTYITIVLAIIAHVVRGQENAQTRIPDSLEECYKNAEIYEPDNRLPATINTLIDLIRKIEDSPDYTQDIRQVAVGLLHRFRMDGIKHATGNLHPSVLPFSPSEYQFSKHRLLLSRLIPGNAHNFPNNTLSAVERVYLFLINSHLCKFRIY